MLDVSRRSAEARSRIPHSPVIAAGPSATHRSTWARSACARRSLSVGRAGEVSTRPLPEALPVGARYRISRPRCHTIPRRSWTSKSCTRHPAESERTARPHEARVACASAHPPWYERMSGSGARHPVVPTGMDNPIQPRGCLAPTRAIGDANVASAPPLPTCSPSVPIPDPGPQSPAHCLLLPQPVSFASS
jgi:hypothetical protein